jgi:hypothetical protein
MHPRDVSARRTRRNHIDDGFRIASIPLKTKLEARLVSRIRIVAMLRSPQVEVALPRQLFENRIFTNCR